MTAPYERIMVLDFETAWDKRDYTLSKMTTEEYLRDARFKAWGAAYRFLDSADPPQWIAGPQLEKFFAEQDWKRTAVAAHNAQFDVSILTWHYGHRPCFIFDTLSMARALRGVEAKNSLAVLAEAFNLPPKGNSVYSTSGYFDALQPHIMDELAEYCRHDVFLCEQIFKRLVQNYPTKELRLIDMTLRMYTEPVLQLDPHMLAEAIEEERIKREALLSRLAISDQDLASNERFANLLRTLGVEPPQKISKTTKKLTYAFAKNDALFQALLNSDDENISLLCEARLKVKSTLERTRAQRFLDIARRGTLPVPLNYYGAHTGRYAASKGSSLNLQNLKRGSFLRQSIMAPEGYVLVVADLSQIEPRVLAWLTDYKKLLDIFASGADAYAAFGAQMFGIPGMTKESHPVLRQSAKSALLGAGYGLGWLSFAAQLLTGFLGAPPIRYDKTFARQLGLTVSQLSDFLAFDKDVASALSIPRICTDTEIIVHCLAAKAIIDSYRQTAVPVKTFWQSCDSVILHSLSRGKEIEYKCLKFMKGQIVLPNGMALRYPDLKETPDDRGRSQWTYGAQHKKLYGGKLTENIVQAVARCVMTDGMLRIQKRYSCVLTVHDEAVVLVPEDEADIAKPWVREQMTIEPRYMPGIPLAADVGVGKRYGEAK